MPFSVYSSAVLTILIIVLSMNVTRLRLRYRIAFGDANKPELTTAIRAHGNTLEQSLVFIVLLYFIDCFAAIDKNFIIIISVVFFAARIFYCLGLFFDKFIFRKVGHGVSMLVFFSESLILLLS